MLEVLFPSRPSDITRAPDEETGSRYVSRHGYKDLFTLKFLLEPMHPIFSDRHFPQSTFIGRTMRFSSTRKVQVCCRSSPGRRYVDPCVWTRGDSTQLAAGPSPLSISISFFSCGAHVNSTVTVGNKRLVWRLLTRLLGQVHSSKLFHHRHLLGHPGHCRVDLCCSAHRPNFPLRM